MSDVDYYYYLVLFHVTITRDDVMPNWFLSLNLDSSNAGGKSGTGWIGRHG